MSRLKDFLKKFSWGGSYEEYYKSISDDLEKDELSEEEAEIEENPEDVPVDKEKQCPEILESLKGFYKKDIKEIERSREEALSSIKEYFSKKEQALSREKDALEQKTSALKEKEDKLSKLELSLESSSRQNTAKINTLVEKEAQIDEKVLNLSIMDERLYSYEMAIRKLERRIEDKELSLLEEVRKSLEIIQEADVNGVPNEVEWVSACVDLMKKVGFQKAEPVHKGKAFGADILAEKDGTTYSVQCVSSRCPVGVDAVRAAISGKGFHQTEKALVITNSVYTSTAKELALIMDVQIWDKALLNNLEEDDKCL